MSSRRWYVVATGTLVWTIAVLLSGAGDSFDAFFDTAFGGAFSVAILVSWLLIPTFIYLDWRAIRGDVAWDPTIAVWVLASFIWFPNVVAGAAYCLRRDSALRDTVPSNRWFYGILASLGLWSVFVGADLVVEYVSLGPLYDVLFGPVLFLGWLLLPVTLFLDIARVRGYTDWEPTTSVWIIASVIPAINILSGVGYVVRRRRAFDEADDPTTVSLDRDATTTDDVAISSPWYRRALGVFAVYFLLLVGIGAVTGETGTGFELVAVFLWVPFGLAFAPMVYFDLEAITDQGVEWGPTRYLYLFSAVIQAAAFWYLIRRLMKVRQAKRYLNPPSGDDGVPGDDRDRPADAADPSNDPAADAATDKPEGGWNPVRPPKDRQASDSGESDVDLPPNWQTDDADRSD